MLNVLGLDISSSVIGWSILSCENGDISLSSYGHMKPPSSKKGSLAFRMSVSFDEVQALFDRLKPDVVAIEAYANKFSPGRSSARTIIVLSSFNEMVSMACIKTLDIEPEKHTVSRIRSILSKEYGIKINTKDDVFDFILKRFPNFQIRKNRNKTISKTVYDESDSIAVALASIISRRNTDG